MSYIHIFVLSDGTGETAYRMLKAGVLQFQEQPVITRYAKVRSEDQIREILGAAGQSKALIVYTFVSAKLREATGRLASERSADTLDLLGPMMDRLSAHFQKKPSSRPGLLHQVDEEYFDRIEAIDYAIRHDHKGTATDLEAADIVLVGVSRTSKTPLSIYLAQEGWRVANVEISVGDPLPKRLATADQRKIAALSIDPSRLHEIRRVRVKQSGQPEASYDDPERIRAELEYAHSIFQEHPHWPMIDVSGKSIEEISQQVLDALFGRERAI